MSSTAEKLEQEEAYPSIRTSKDGRQYVTTGDVLKSRAGRDEIRRQAKIETSESANTNDNKSNGSDPNKK